jgi:peptide/nickel transport system ATP-binding protein
MLKINDLTIAFQNKIVLNKLSFTLEKGKTIGLVGESGSGKSLTSLAIMGLLPEQAKITQGSILYNDNNLLNFSEKQYRNIRGKSIAMIFQEPMTSLNPVFTIGYQIEEVLKTHQNLTPKERKEKVLDILNLVGIPDPSSKYHQYPHEISGGQKQRVVIACAIACDPDLLIADEPTTALDVTIQKQVLDLLLSIQEKQKMSMIFITHDLAVVSQMVDNVLVLYKGDSVEYNSTKNLFKNPKDKYTKGLLSCRPELNLDAKRLPTLTDFLSEEGYKKELKEKKIFQDTLLEIKNLSVQFALPKKSFFDSKTYLKAVDNVTLSIKKGETLGLVGESGSGKTTLGRAILRLENPSEGSIYYNNQDIYKVNHKESFDLRRKMQIIFQDPYSSLNPRMNIEDTLIEPMLIHKLYPSKKEALEKVKELLNKVGLEQSFLKRYPHEFSGGQRQRISIARALSVKPDFIVCDESVSALDVSVQAQILNLLCDLQDDYNLTYIFISHDLSVISFMSDYVAVMNQGSIVEYNTTDNIYHHPNNEYTQSLLKSLPKFKYE